MGGLILVASWRFGSASSSSTSWLAASQIATRTRAFANGLRVVNFEQHVTHRLYELTFQQFVDQRHWLALAVSWTYWNSEFTVLGLALLCVYMRRHEAFTRFRNTILLANVLGLFGYVFLPTAPPRLLGVGFADSHTDGLVAARGEPLRGDAEPPRGGLADRRPRARPALPPLVVEALLDGLAGLGLVRRDGDRKPLLARLRRRPRGRAIALGIVYGPTGPAAARRSASLSRRPPTERGRPRAPLVRSGNVTGRRLSSRATRPLPAAASRSITGLARTRVTPNALTTSGVLLCAAASVLVLFENRHELLFYWLGAFVFVAGSVLDILDGALARAGGKTTPFGAFLDSTTDRVSEGFMLAAIAFVFARRRP